MPKRLAQQIVFAELTSIIEGHGLAGARGGNASTMTLRLSATDCAVLRLLPQQQRAPRSAFLRYQQELSRLAEAHEVGFPIAGARSGFHHGRTIMNGNPVQDGGFRPSAIGLTLSATDPGLRGTRPSKNLRSQKSVLQGPASGNKDILMS